MIHRDKAKLIIQHYQKCWNARDTYTKFKLTKAEFDAIMKVYRKNGYAGFTKSPRQYRLTLTDLFLRRKWL